MGHDTARPAPFTDGYALDVAALLAATKKPNSEVRFFPLNHDGCITGPGVTFQATDIEWDSEPLIHDSWKPAVQIECYNFAGELAYYQQKAPSWIDAVFS